MVNKVLVTGDSVDARLLEPLVEAGLQVVNPPGVLSESELAEQLADSTAYLLGGDEFASSKALQDAKHLKVVAFLGVGYENFVDAKGAGALGVAVTNTPGTLVQSVAEFTVGQTLSATRQLAAYEVRSAKYEAGSETKRHDLAALRVGIVGLGAIGTRIAEILTAGFGCEVSYWSRTRKQDEEGRIGLAWLDFDHLMERSDVLILMTPGNERTAGLIDEKALVALPEGAILVNTARPEIVAPKPLLQLLKERKLGSAVFDGFYDDAVDEREELLSLGTDRLLVTGHIASLTHEARDGMAIMAVGSILSILDSGSDVHVVNQPNS